MLNCDGRVSQAWRELSGRNALSEDLLSHHLSNPASKSYCPTRIREAVKYEVGMMDDIHHGPRQDEIERRPYQPRLERSCGDGLALRG